MNLKDIQHDNKNSDNGYNYDGIPIFCTTGVHEAIFDDFVKNNNDLSIKILILGSGSGAFDKRLLDKGFNNITSIDFIPNKLSADNIKFIELDLNKDFSDLGEFDVIFTIEVIEHLENQFNFLRCIKSILSKDGVLYLSTPNVENTFARLKYFLTGELHWFSNDQLIGTGHINPVFKHIFNFNLSQNNLIVEKYFTNNNVWLMAMKNPNWLYKVIYAIFFPFTFLLKNIDNSDIKIYKIVNKI